MTGGRSLKETSPARLKKLRKSNLGGLKSDFNFSMSTKNTKFILYLGNKLVTLQPELCTVV